jgi:hypothetical protein
LAIVTAIGCGGDDLVIGGTRPITPTSAGGTATPSCGQLDDACSVGADCCSGNCFLDACQ